MEDCIKIDEFRKLDREARRTKSKLFALTLSDPPATKEELIELEKAIGILLPSDYKEFLGEFGGGSYGLITIFSANQKSEWYLGAKFSEAQAYLPKDFLPISDDSAGGMFVLGIVNGRADEAIMYWNSDGGLRNTKFNNILEFIARYSFENA